MMPEPEPAQRTVRVSNFTEWLRVTEAGVRLSTDTDCDEERTIAAAAAGQRLMTMLVFLLETILKGKETYLVGDYFTTFSVTHANFLS